MKTLTVNWVPYGKIADRDAIIVRNGNVYRNGAQILPTVKTDRNSEQGVGVKPVN